MPLRGEISVALIVPLRNEQALLPELLNRLQQLSAYAVIIVDGGSQDRTTQLLANSPLHWIASEPGRAVQMNAGAAQCDSDILLFLHADTVISDRHIDAVRSAMGNNRVVGGRFDVAFTNPSLGFRLIAWSINLRSRLSGISTGDQCQFIRRSVFETMGGFPEQQLMEDIELSRGMKRQGRVVALRDNVITSSRRWQRYGLIRTVLLMWYLRLLYWFGVPAERLVAHYRQAR